MTLSYPAAFDAPELLLDGVHSVVGEDWTELADAFSACGAIAGNLGSEWSAYQHAGKILDGLRRVASGVVAQQSSAFAAGVTVTFPAGVFDIFADIAVVAFRGETGIGAVSNDGTTPLTFGVTGISTGGATIYGFTETGSAPTGTTQVKVGWIAFQRRTAPTLDPDSPAIFSFNPDTLPPVLSGFDRISGDLPNTIAFGIETLTRATGKNPAGILAWSTVAGFLNLFDAMVTGSLQAQADAFDADGGGLIVSVDGTPFPDPAQVQVHAISQTDGADSGASPGNNYPIVFAADSIQGGGSSPLSFRLKGWARTGADPTVTDQITVLYVVRRTIGAPS